jgi:hypothetical protein
MRRMALAWLALAGCGGKDKESESSAGCSAAATVVDGTWIDGVGCQLDAPLADQCTSMVNQTWASCPTFDDVLAAVGWPSPEYGVFVQSCDAGRDSVCWGVEPGGETCAVFDADGSVVQIQVWGDVVGVSAGSVCCDDHMVSAMPVYGDPAARCANPAPYSTAP